VEKKMSKSEFINRMTQRIEPVAGDLGLRLVDLEFASAGKHSILRIFLDRDGGIGLEELARASHEIEAVLDAHDDVPGVYSLECSSPGVNRRLKGQADFEAHVGMNIRLRTVEPIDGSRNFRGELVAVGLDGLELAVPKGPAVRIPLTAIEKANYEHDFDRDLRERHAHEA
jgi:ribosome maturation factor RimP